MARYIELAPQLVRLYRLNLDCKEVIKEFLLTAVTADVRENVHATWQRDIVEDAKSGRRIYEGKWVCSSCGYGEDVPTVMGEPTVWNFCPNCGAEMEANDNVLEAQIEPGMPTADVPDRKVWKWINTGSGEECSKCHEIQYGYDSFRRYCPNCGAEMGERREDV